MGLFSNLLICLFVYSYPIDLSHMFENCTFNVVLVSVVLVLNIGNMYNISNDTKVTALTNPQLSGTAFVDIAHVISGTKETKYTTATVYRMGYARNYLCLPLLY